VIRKIQDGVYFCPSIGWYPGQPDSSANRVDFDILFHYPKKLILVATGNLVGEAKEGVSQWKTDIPIAAAGFAFGDYKVYSQKVGAIDVQIYGNQYENISLGAAGRLDPAGMVKLMATEVANCLRVFQDYFGPYPYTHLAVTDIPYSYGQGWPGLIYLSLLSFLDSTQRNALGVGDQTRLTDFFRAHETSHQWWGHRVGWKSYHDQWLSEGFAQFSGNLYVQFRENPADYIKRLKIDRDDLLNKNRFGHVYESLGPVWMGIRLASSQGPDGYNNVIYQKGGYVLHMLRMMLNDSSNPDTDHIFKDMMHDFTQTFDNKAASTEDFKAIVEKHMLPAMAAEGKHNMDWFFREYVYGTGVPHYDYDTEIREQNGKWMVTGTISRTGVPDNWIDILPVYVHAQKRVVRLGWIRVTGKSTPLQLSLPTKPDKIVLNENEDILAIVKQK
jgi:aminopeptidase N